MPLRVKQWLGITLGRPYAQTGLAPFFNFPPIPAHPVGTDPGLINHVLVFLTHNSVNRVE